MNRIQRIVCMITFLILALAFITVQSSAQTPTLPVETPTIATPPPASLPIGSKAMLRAYALEQVAGSDISVWSEAMMWSSNSVTDVYFHPEVTPSIDEAIQAISFNRFSFKVSDKAKPLQIYAQLHDKNGMSLFSGAVKASVSSSGQIVCPSGVKMKMNSLTPIYVGENVSNASVRTDDGNRQSLNVWNGYVFFHEGYTEKDGMLVLEYNNGIESQQIGYALRTGLQVPNYSVSGNVEAYVQDFQSFLDRGMPLNATVYVGVTGLVGDGHEAPVASITVTSTRPVRFYCTIRQAGTNTVLERPQYGWFYKKGSDSELRVLLPVGQWSEETMLDAGEWFFYPETSLFETPAPVNDGGKG